MALKKFVFCPMTQTLKTSLEITSTDTGEYRYFFNGQEADNEMFVEMASFGYEFRQYDSRLARWWSIDPKWNEYPSVSSYVFCNGSPIMLVDPNGDTVVIPNKDDQLFIDNLINPNSGDYSKYFHNIYTTLQQSSTTYTFESWSYDASREEDGLFDGGDENNNPSIHFTKDDNPQIYDKAIGASKYRVLFEETYHAYQYEKRGKVVRSCISEAAAWKFSTLAPGTRMSCYDYRYGGWMMTVMGRIHYSSIFNIALGFKFGMPKTNTSYGIDGPGLYSDMKLGTAKELKKFLPWFIF